MAGGAASSVAGLIGRWRIVEMSDYDSDDIDLIEPGFVEFDEDGMGEFGFVAASGQIDYRETERDGRVAVEFTWEGVDEGDSVSGRGWAVLLDETQVEGRLFFHLGDDSSFRAERMSPADHAGDR
jgi:hypothetical protein